jgi:hypothetical protein
MRRETIGGHPWLKFYRNICEADHKVDLYETWPEGVRSFPLPPPGGEYPRALRRALSKLGQPFIISVSRIEMRDLRKTRWDRKFPPMMSVVENGEWTVREVPPGPEWRPIDVTCREPKYYFRDDMYGCHLVGDDRRRKFFSAIVRMAGKYMTNSWEIYDIESGEVVETWPSSIYWAGPESVRLAKLDPHFFHGIYFCHERNTWIGRKPVPKIR